MGIRNGPTVKPLEHRIGMVARRMTPELARVVERLSAVMSSREVEGTKESYALCIVLCGKLACDQDCIRLGLRL